MTHELLLVGGGPAHLEVLRRFGESPPAGLRVSLVTPESETAQPGMIPGALAGLWGEDDGLVDLRRLAGFAGARLILARARGLDLGARRLLLAGRPSLPYDSLSFDLDAALEEPAPGAAAHATPLRPLSRFLARWRRVRNVVVTQRELHVVILGGGAEAVELMLGMQARLRSLRRGGDSSGLRFTLITRGEPLPNHPPRLRQAALAALQAGGATILRDREVVQVTPGNLHTLDGQRITFDEAFWEPSAGAPAWLENAGLALNPQGRLLVEPTLNTRSQPEVFAAGDSAAVRGASALASPDTSQRQGAALADNLRRRAEGRRLQPYRGARREVAFLALGLEEAAVSRGGMTRRGRWVWRWKQRQDRRWLQRYQSLPRTRPTALWTQGATAPEAAVTRAFDRLIRQPDAEARGASGHPGSDGRKPSAAASIGASAGPAVARLLSPPGYGHRLAQAMEVCSAAIDDPHLFGRIAANHALAPLYALGATPTTAAALAGLPADAPARLEEDVFQMLSGAQSVLASAGAALTGVSALASALPTLGFSLSGSAPERAVVDGRALAAGDCIILTKPLGAGALVAAEARGGVRAPLLDAALAAMAEPAEDVAVCIQHYAPSACAAVASGGRGGALLKLLGDTPLAARLDLDRLPALPDALAAAAESLERSEAESRARAILSAGEQRHPRMPLLLAPEIAGGLLVALRPERASACLEALHRLGHRAATQVAVIEASRADSPCLAIAERRVARAAG